jgi:glycosyltransferase involved in cell wall biosynthesis
VGSRILMVADEFHPAMGGAIRLIDEAARALASRGHDVWVVVGTDDGSLPAAEDRHGFHVRRFHFDPTTVLHLNLTALVNGARAVSDTLRRHGPFDVIHCHNVFAASGVAMGRMAGHVPSLSTFHGAVHLEFETAATARRFDGRPLRRAVQPAFVPLYSRWLRFLQARVLHSGPIMVLSPSMAAVVRTVTPGYPTERLRVVPGGVDVRRFTPAADRAATRRALGLPDEGPLLLAVGRFFPVKGFESLLAALDDVRTREAGVHLVLAGNGPLESRLRDQVHALGLQRSVTFAGNLSGNRLVHHYQAADLFVLSSRFESFGLVTLEALACGTPVLTSPAAGSAFVVRALGAELVADDCEAPALARGILRFVDRWKGDLTLRERCRSLVEHQYSWERIAERLDDVYQEVAGGMPA